MLLMKFVSAILLHANNIQSFLFRSKIILKRGESLGLLVLGLPAVKHMWVYICCCQ